MYSKVTSIPGTIAIDDFDASNYHGSILPGSYKRKISLESGEFINQEYVNDNFSISLNDCFFEKKSFLSFENVPNFLQFTCSLQQRIGLLFSKKPIWLNEGKYLVSVSPKRHPLVQVEARKKLLQFSIQYSREMIEPLANYFEVVRKILGSVAETYFLPKASPLWLTLEMWQLINQLLNCPYESPIREFFFDDKVKDLLFFMLVNEGRPAVFDEDLSTSDIEKIHFAHHLILHDLTEHLSIRHLSKKVGLNEYKLKVGFKHIFKAGPFTVLKNARMQKAYDLLLSTDKPIKEIQSIAGYASLTSFIAAFRKFHGVTPGTVRYK